MDTKFFEFPQNNSGGYYVRDTANGVGESIIVEATDAQHALERLQEIGDKTSCDFWSWCDCCGERWPTFLSDREGLESPEPKYTRGEYFVHYLDGRIEYEPKQEDHED